MPSEWTVKIGVRAKAEGPASSVNGGRGDKKGKLVQLKRSTLPERGSADTKSEGVEAR